MSESFSFSKNTVGFLVDGVVDEKRIGNLNNQIAETIERYGTINLYLEDNGIDTFTLPAIAKEIAFKVKHANQLNKVALVSDAKWVEMCSKIENVFLPSEIRSFKTEDRLQAMSWIAER